VSKPDTQPSIPTHLLENMKLGKPLHRGPAKRDLEELSHERRLGDLLALRERAQKRLHLRRHASGHKRRRSHDHGVLNKSSREAILHRFDFEQKLNIRNAEFVDSAAETPTDF